MREKRNKNINQNHSRVSLSGIFNVCRGRVVQKQRSVEDPRLQISGMVPLFHNSVRAFTLIELLVVVLIIGILTAIALPQYTATVEKSRLAEVLTNVATMKQQIDLYLLQNGRPASGQSASYKEFTSADLSGGSWNGNVYSTANFSYQPQITHPQSTIVITRLPNQYQLWISDGYHAWMAPEYDVDSVIGKWMPPTCVTQKTVLGRKICKQLQSQGYQYLDEEFD